MNRQMQLVRLAIAGLLGAVLCLGGSMAAAAQAKNGKITKDEFFIVSSFSEKKHELLLKLPTEVTMQMSVTDKTSIVDEHGKHLKASDLRSGDTAYITYTQKGSGAQALSIRLGPMTVKELYRRYLNGPAPPAAHASTPKPAPRAKTGRGPKGR